jgi:hypothetical protein
MPIIGVSKMSRTNRKIEYIHSGALRYPHTENERKQLDGILHDEELKEFPVSGLNHMKAREHKLPSAWDDKIVSAYYETEHVAYGTKFA